MKPDEWEAYERPRWEQKRDAGLAHGWLPDDLAAASVCRRGRTGHRDRGLVQHAGGPIDEYGYSGIWDACLACGASTEGVGNGKVRLPRTPNRRPPRWLWWLTRRRWGCQRCGTTWGQADSHSTEYSTGSGLFPLCELCWRELTPAQRLPWYRKLVDHWKDPRYNGTPDAETKWAAIEQSVLAGN